MKTYTKEEMLAIVSKAQRYDVDYEYLYSSGTEGTLRENADFYGEWIKHSDLIDIINNLE